MYIFDILMIMYDIRMIIYDIWMIYNLLSFLWVLIFSSLLKILIFKVSSLSKLSM